MSRVCAPLALFVYNRPEHTRQTLAALAQNILAADTDLFIFSDGPGTASAAADVAAVRALIRNISGLRSVTLIERETNLGLAASIVEGVTRLCAMRGRVIVLEDDLATSPHFLTYMNDALDLYAEDERVIAVHGFMFPVAVPVPETFFLADPGCWGWATWKRGWDLFDPDAERHLRSLRQDKRGHEFNLDGSYDYLGMLEGRISGRNNSWAVLWYASAFAKGKLTLYPGRSLVRNIGHDGSGTHGGGSGFAVTLSDRPVAVEPIPVTESRAARAALASYLSGLRSGPGRFKERLRRLFNGPRPKR